MAKVCRSLVGNDAGITHVSCTEERLRLAIKNGHYECARFLLQNGADPSSRYFSDPEMSLMYHEDANLIALLVSLFPTHSCKFFRVHHICITIKRSGNYQFYEAKSSGPKCYADDFRSWDPDSQFSSCKQSHICYNSLRQFICEIIPSPSHFPPSLRGHMFNSQQTTRHYVSILSTQCPLI